MWARVSTYQFPSSDVESAIERFSEALGELDEPGLKRAELLVDRSNGKALTVTVWDSEDTLETSAEAANRLRASATDAAGGSILDVAHFEIVQSETY